MTETIFIQSNGWTARLKKPVQDATTRLLILLHGWTGDENSMDVIARKFPPEFTILSPRAPFPVDGGGYSWLPPGGGLHSKIDEYLNELNSFLDWIDSLTQIGPVPNTFDLAGFSQGAAASYALSINWPGRIHRLGGMAGFMPQGVEAYLANMPLRGKAAFIAHGRQDERIRIEAGYQAADLLTRAGAQVEFCASDTGHKLSPDCHRRLIQFFVNGLPAADEGDKPQENS